MTKKNKTHPVWRLFKKVFSAKTAKIIGMRFMMFIRFIGLPHKTAMWIFGVITALLTISTINSISSLISLEGFIVIPLIGTLVKSLLLISLCIGWYNYHQLEKIQHHSNTKTNRKTHHETTNQQKQQIRTKKNNANRKKYFR